VVIQTAQAGFELLSSGHLKSGWLGSGGAVTLDDPREGGSDDLYTLGYDKPESYAIAKDGRMYYAFFASRPDEIWKGEVELRGLQAGSYRVLDYVNNRELGTVDAAKPRLAAEFTGSLLVEVSR
jgi:hypothetical protein